MTTYLRVILACAVIVYFLIIFYFVKKKTLALKYTLLWLLAGVVMGVLVLSPGLLRFFVNLVGIQTPMYGLMVAALCFVIMILMSLTAIVSKQADKIKNLAQDNAMLEKRIRELEAYSGTLIQK